MESPPLDSLRQTIIRVYPDLEGASFTLATAGWHSVAVDVDDRLIFKFPRHDVARAALVKEAALLARIRPAVAMPVPDLTLHVGPPLFSVHGKLKGEHLPPDAYAVLPEAARERLARKLAQFYAEIHALDDGAMTAAGAGALEAWLSPPEITAKALPVVPAEHRLLAETTIAAFEALPPDPYGLTYGFFDGHGWNMAFDHARQELNGIYDFADSGIGPLHREFIYSNLISSDLTERIVTHYERLTGRALDRKRILVLCGIHRLTELAELADDPEHAPEMVRFFNRWAETAGALL
ncbi:phosphotransferase family protein [Ensifer adhaerens]|uniref:phosphotransferase family protein n=1 Tax=Ensifer adhaerens TaxID=106592 RepID=UPI00098F872B|nr:aminoglycoside phosphotransferase family protein [Ensifer adhaerens]